MDASLHFKNHALNAVDAKGRVSVPASFRAQLVARSQLVAGENKLQIGLHPSGDYLNGQDSAADGEIEAMLLESVSELPAIERMTALERLRRDFNGATDEFKFDNTGRIMLSPMMRDLAGIEEHAFFIGAGVTFQIWAPRKAMESLPEGSVLHRTLAYLLKDKGIAL
ncbi:MAG: hypothetical protein JWO65_1544 [Sphingomonas bacterium]|nr:hypothetical protein [Sphingomonas bacterium]